MVPRKSFGARESPAQKEKGLRVQTSNFPSEMSERGEIKALLPNCLALAKVMENTSTVSDFSVVRRVNFCGWKLRNSRSPQRT